MSPEDFVKHVVGMDEVNEIFVCPMLYGYSLSVLGSSDGVNQLMCYTVSENDIDKLTECFKMLLEEIRTKESCELAEEDADGEKNSTIQ